jgi:phosphatidylinositol-3-phosphatase
VAERDDDQIPGQAGPAGDDSSRRARNACHECGSPLAADQRYCVKCGTRRGLLPGAVAGTVAAMAAAGKAAAAGGAKGAGGAATGGAAGAAGAGASGGGGAGAGGRGSGPGGKGGDGGKGSGKGGWSWMPSPPAIAIAVIGMLALGVGLGSAMSEIASSAPLSTILLEYPQHAAEGKPPAEEPEEESEESGGEEIAEAPEGAPEIIEEGPVLPEEVVEEAPSVLPEEATEEPEEENPFKELEELEQREKEQEEAEAGAEGALPEVKHAFLIVLGEGGYDETFGAAAGAPYLSRVLPKKGELLPNYYGVTSGVLANEIALLSGQGPTPETALNCPTYTAIAPGTVSETGEQVEGNGCVYGEAVKSLPTQLSEKEVSWRAYVQDMENGGAIGQPWRCRKPTLGGPDLTVPTPGDQYATWRNPVVYFSAIAAGAECEKHDVGFELLTKDLAAKKKTPTLSLIFPNVCHSGGEYECEPGAPKGAVGVAQELKSLVPAIMSSAAYEEGGLIMITSAQAPQTGERLDQKSCCLAPVYPNLPVMATTPPTPPPGASTTAPETSTSPTEAEAETTTTTKYTEESVLETGGGGKVGLLMISPFVEPGAVVEGEYANHFTLLKTLATMLGVEPTGYAAEEEVPTLSSELFVEAPEEVTPAPKSEGESPAQAGRPRGTS